MPSPKRKGRMINKSISNSHRFAALSPQAAVLFSMLIPHYNSHGKLNGGPGYIKDEVCPLVPYLTIKNIPKLLQEIHDKTNVKWFFKDGRHWIHSLKFKSEHQTLSEEKIGEDLLPSYSGVSPELVGQEVEGEVEVEEEVEGEGSERTPGASFAGNSPSRNGAGGSRSETDRETGDGLATNGHDLDPALKAILAECPHLAFISSGASSAFWDHVLAICEPYPQAGPVWLNMKIRKWDQWFRDNKSRRSRKREFLESRIMRWLEKDLEKMAMRKS